MKSIQLNLDINTPSHGEAIKIVDYLSQKGCYNFYFKPQLNNGADVYLINIECSFIENLYDLSNWLNKNIKEF